MNLTSIVHAPLIVVSPTDTVMHAIETTLPAKVGAVAVIDEGVMTGIFTERDVMLKVVHKRRDPDKTRVGEVMTSPVITVPDSMTPKEALRLMLEKHIRHLPVSGSGDEVAAMLSIRDLLVFLVDDLTNDLKHMASFIGADSPGG